MLLLMMMVMVMVMSPQGVQAQSTCTAVTTMKSRITYITCHFQKDASKYDFNVQFFPSDGSTQETALACNHQNSEELNCHKASGVEFDEHQKIRYYFTFARNAALSPAGSEYMCQRVPSDGGVTAERCKVGEIEFPEVPQPTSPPADTDDSGESPAVIILLVINIVIVVAVGICGALAYVKRYRITKWWTKQTIGLLGPEDLTDPEKNTSRDPRMPDGWPAYFFNMGWREGMAGEGRDTGIEDKGNKSPQPSQEQLQSKGDKQDRERDDNLAEVHARQPLLPDKSWSPPKTKDVRAGAIGASIQESTTDAETFHDARENPVSPGEEASITPGKKDMKKLQAEQKKAEEKRVKKEKEAAKQRAKETIRNAEREAKRITEEAKGQSKEEKEKAKSEADRIKKDGKRLSQQIKEGAGKGDNEGNQEATTPM